MIYFEIPSAQEAGHRTPRGIAAAEARPDGRIQQESKKLQKNVKRMSTKSGKSRLLK
jgi:hypothetical protein